MIPPRCEHDVIIVNPETAPKSNICEGCYVGLKSKGPIWTPPTVDNISVTPPAFVRPWRRDPAWSGRPHVQVRQPGRVAIPTPQPTNRPTGEVILVPPTPRTIPYNVVTKWGTLVRDIEWQSRTPGREIDRAFSRFTLTSLDRGFTKGNVRSFETGDDDETVVFEPTQSMTMMPAPESRIEVVLPRHPGSPARSLFENDGEHYRPEDLQLLPPDFREKSLGIKGRVDAFVVLEVLRAMKDFDAVEPVSSNGNRNARLAEFISNKFKASPFVAPQGVGMEEFAMSKHREDAVTARLSEITEKQVRMMRERLAGLGIHGTNQPA